MIEYYKIAQLRDSILNQKQPYVFVLLEPTHGPHIVLPVEKFTVNAVLNKHIEHLEKSRKGCSEHEEFRASISADGQVTLYSL